MAAPKDGFGGGAGRASWASSRAFQGCQTRGYACKPCSHFQKATCLSSLSKTILRRVLHAWTTEARIEHYLLRSLPPPALKESIRIQHAYQHPSRLNFQKGLFTPVRTSMELHSKDMKRRKQRFEVQHLDGRVSQRDWTCVCTGPGRWGSFCPLKPFCWHSLITSQCYHQLRLESHSLAPKGREHSALRISP